MMDSYFEKVLGYMVDLEIAKTFGNSLPVFSQFDASKYPSKLYRFRSGKKYDYSALKEDYIWIDYPNSFIDPEDARINLGQSGKPDDIVDSEKRLTIAFADRIWRDNSEGLKKLGFDNNSFINLVVSEPNPDMSIAKFEEMIQSIAKNLPLNEQTSILETIIDPLKSIESEFEVVKSKIIGTNRNGVKVCCLTETFDNKKMWEDYAGQYSGFVIEYSIPEISDMTENDIKVFASLFPVSYYDSIPEVDIYPIVYDIISNKTFPDISNASRRSLIETIKQALSKQNVYNPEYEWRLIRGKEESNRFRFPYATAVYTGYRIKKHNYAILKNLCNSKGLSIYRQQYDDKMHCLTYRLEDGD